VKTCIRWAFIFGAILWFAAQTRSQSPFNTGSIVPGSECAQ
jgi:hypothetical protein